MWKEDANFPGSLVFVAGESVRTNILNFTFRLSILLAYSFLLSSLMILFVSVVSVVTYFSFLILLIWILSLFYPDESAKGLSIVFIFLKSHLLVSLIFTVVFFVSISFFSALIFMISFLPLTLSFVYSSYTSCFRCKDRLFIWDLSCSLR